MALDWRADAVTVAIVTGALSGVLSGVGCVVGGWVAERRGPWWAFHGAGVNLAVILAVGPRTPLAFASGVLCYAFGTGVSFAAYSALLLHVIGRGAASTKYAMLSSFGNVPVVCMPALNGWTHDQYGTAAMLMIEALAGGVSVILFLAVLLTVTQREAASRRGLTPAAAAV